MAFEWIKMRTNLWMDHRINVISVRIKEKPATIIGGLYCLWSIADTFSSDGLLPDYDCETFNIQSGIDGFAEELIRIGWLEQTEYGLSVLEFEKHNGESTKKRFQETLKKQTYRNKGGKSRTKRGQKGDKPGTIDGQSMDLEREEEREREEEGNKKDSLSSSDDSLKPDLQEVIDQWNQTDGVARTRKVSKKRIQSLKSRMREDDWDWKAALTHFPLECFRDGTWRPDFEWFIRPDSVNSILEGKYDWSKSRAGPGKPKEMEFQGLKDFLNDGENDDTG
jgi:hypothetical protein